MSIHQEIHSLSPSALIELFVLDATKQEGGIMYFHDGTNALQGDIVWQGITYTALPMQAEGFEKRSQGALPRPKVKLSNVQGIIAAQAREYGNYLGCKLIRKRTFARFLDAVNFPGGNVEADPEQQMQDEVWFIDRKSAETPQFIEFELASALDITGVMLPRRQVIQNCCSWKYRGPECGYTGGPVATESGAPTSDAAKDRCGKRLSDCKLRHTGALPYGGFPGCGLVR